MSEKALGKALDFSVNCEIAEYFDFKPWWQAPKAPVTAARPGGMGAALPPGRLRTGFGLHGRPQEPA
jgi:hypothetical protein